MHLNFLAGAALFGIPAVFGLIVMVE